MDKFISTDDIFLDHSRSDSSLSIVSDNTYVTSVDLFRTKDFMTSKLEDTEITGATSTLDISTQTIDIPTVTETT